MVCCFQRNGGGQGWTDGRPPHCKQAIYRGAEAGGNARPLEASDFPWGDFRWGEAGAVES